MAKTSDPVCARCGGTGEYRVKQKQRFQVKDAKTGEWTWKDGEVWVDVRCSH